jgi:penicillin-binding protein 1C
MKHVNWFVLPPAMEWYYKSKNPSYKELPPFKSGCEPNNNSMELIYPKHYSKIYVPVELDGSMGKTIFEAAHRSSSSKIHWHLDGKYIASTENIHQMGLAPDEGEHTLTLVDDEGESSTIEFEIISRKKK